MEAMKLYRRAQDGLETALAAVPAGRWDAPSACADWTVRDVAGHVIWAQLQLHAWATGAENPPPTGAPGTRQPGVTAGNDPVAAWRAARAEAAAALTEEALTTRTASLPGLGEVPLGFVISLLITDSTAHTWDIAHGLGMDVRLEPDLVTAAFDWARAHVVRAPGFFGPQLTAPAGSDEQTRLLAYLGRAAWQPAPA